MKSILALSSMFKETGWDGANRQASCTLGCGEMDTECDERHLYLDIDA